MSDTGVKGTLKSEKVAYNKKTTPKTKKAIKKCSKKTYCHQILYFILHLCSYNRKTDKISYIFLH